MPVTQEQFNNRFTRTYWRLISETLSPDIAYGYAGIDAYLWASTGQGAPRIISGFRSLSRQRQLAERWFSGNRVGLVAKPARRSWHTLGRALDLDRSDPNYNTFISWWKQWYGPALRVGETFGDPGHADVPGPESPRAAY